MSVSEEKKESKEAIDFKWLPLTRDYALELDDHTLKSQLTSIHPLLPKEVLKSKSVVSSPVGSNNVSISSSPTESPIAKDDPLSMFKQQAATEKPAFFDPLRMMQSQAAEEKQKEKEKEEAAAQAVVSNTEDVSSSSTTSSSSSSTAKTFEPWRDKRARILTKYTTNKSIPVSANFLEEEVVTAPKAVDSAKSRLEELEAESDHANLSQKSYLSQKEYIAHIEEQHERLKAAWENGERVQALKICIQCAKLLGDSSVPQFYPSMYVLLTDILDTFGDLVFERIKSKGIDVLTPGSKVKTAASLPVNFTYMDVSPSAQETCRNWFYKTACIRELMPRLYVDMCLLKCYRFVDSNDSYILRFSRLSKMIRGLGDPLAAAYARAYLATKCGDVWNSFTNDHAKAGESRTIPRIYQNCLIESFEDFLYTFKLLLQENFKSIRYITEEKIKKEEYMDLYSPALEWLLQNIGYKASEDLFFALLQQQRDSCPNSLILCPILSSFNASYISNHALDMTSLIRSCEEISTVPKSKLYLCLGRAFNEVVPPVQHRLILLNDIWKVVTKLTDPVEYIEIAQVFIQYIVVNFTEREVNIFLKDVIKHLKPNNAHLTVQPQLSNLIIKITSHCKELSKIIGMDNFLPILDLLDKPTKLIVSKAILSRFSQHRVRTNDPILIHTLFDVSRACHDSLDSLSFDDEKKQISQLLIHFIQSIDFGRDLEQQLGFYVECRQSFRQLDRVICELVVRVMLLCMKAHKFMKGNHSKKTAAFVKACLAYCHITIPSLEDYFLRLRLLLQCAQVGLINGMIVQSEGFAKAAISLIPDIPSTIEVYKMIVQTEEELTNYIRNFTSFLLLFPGHPEHGPFYLVKGLLNAVQSYEPWKEGTVGKAKVYMSVFILFTTYYQRQFPYHIQNVESNDDLYGNETSYMKQIATFLDTLVSEILTQLTKIGDRADLLSKKQQGTLALDFIHILINTITMTAASATLIVKLYGLAQKSNAVDNNYLVQTLKFIQSKKSTWYQDIANKIQAGAGLQIANAATNNPTSPTSPTSSSTSNTATSKPTSPTGSNSNVIPNPLTS